VFSFSHKADGEKKMALIKYFKKTRIQFIRLLVLVKWAGQMPTIQKCWVSELTNIIIVS